MARRWKVRDKTCWEGRYRVLGKDAVQERRWPHVVLVWILWEWLNLGGAKLPYLERQLCSDTLFSPSREKVNRANNTHLLTQPETPRFTGLLYLDIFLL